MNIKVLKISGNSNINAVAEAIYKHVKRNGMVHLDSIGVKATYMAVKAFIQATAYLIDEGCRINLRPYYVTVNTGRDIKTAIRWTLIIDKNSERMLEMANMGVYKEKEMKRNNQQEEIRILKDLGKEIEEMRDELNRKVLDDNNNNINSKEILELSQKLDRLIAVYLKNI